MTLLKYEYRGARLPFDFVPHITAMLAVQKLITSNIWDQIDHGMSILEETAWNGPVEIVREQIEQAIKLG